MPSQYNLPDYRRRFSSTYPSNINKLEMDIPLVDGSVNDSKLFGVAGTGTTNATSGTTEAVIHDLGVTPNVWDITITPMANGIVYLDPANPPTSTTFNVLGSADSLDFAWKIITDGPSD